VIAAPSNCQTCKNTSFLRKGIGTQQVVTILEKLFPEARIARADLDTTINKKMWRQTMEDFEQEKIDILVGTQTITKGYHFPKVTLVGILWADINLGLPFYNAAEITLQQLIQVAGRAGRQSTESTVIVQAMINHPIFSYLNEQEYGSYYAQEIKNREQVHYPPCARFAEIELKHEDEVALIAEAAKVAKELRNRAGISATILGPSQPPVHRIKNVFSRKIYLKAEQIGKLIELYKGIDQTAYKSSIFFTPNPLS
jgi:primosomal protein N' (replication factor Y)